MQLGELLGIEVDELARVRLVIALGSTLETSLDGLLDLSQAFETVLQRIEPPVGTVRWGKSLKSGTSQYGINCRSADPEAFRQLHCLPQPGLIKPPDFLAIQ